jgi:signal transduction histidine kinase/PAS domain-containing protein
MNSDQSFSDGILDWDCQHDRVHLSSQLLKMLGYGTRSSTLLLEDWYALIHPDDREFVRHRVQTLPSKAMSSSRTSRLTMEHRLKCQDGSYRVFRVQGQVHWSKANTPERLLLFYKSVGDRLSEETAEQRVEVLQALLNALPDFLIRIDGNGIYLDFLCGGEVEVYTATGQIVGESIYDILPYDMAHQRMFYVRQALETGKMQTYDYQFLINGKLFYEEARILKVRDNEVLVIVRDITERKHSEVLLHKSLLREQAIAQILDRIRQTLEIDQVFATVVSEIRRLLECDRAVIYQFNQDWSGQLVAESVQEWWIQLLANDDVDDPLRNAAKAPTCGIKQTVEMESFTDTYLQETHGGKYQAGIPYQRVDDIYQENFEPCYVELLENMQARAYVITPVFKNKQLWGLFGVYQNDGPRQWEDDEVRAVVQVGIQLAIAIQQASLFTQLKQEIEQQERTLEELKQTQLQLIQSEKLSSLGQLVAGIAHELNNPVNFISGNIDPVNSYVQELLRILHLYQQEYPNPSPELQNELQNSDLEFIKQDLPEALSSIEIGSQQVFEVVSGLKTFSRLDQAGKKAANLNEGIDVTLSILKNRLKGDGPFPDIEVEKTLSTLPMVECHPAQINQVFMNLLVNAIDAIDQRRQKEHRDTQTTTPGHIEIVTHCLHEKVAIQISDNGSGMTEDTQKQLFEPFFTTKPVDKGTGLGLAISYQIIVSNHGGQLKCVSSPGRGTQMIIELPIAASPAS